MSCLLKEDVDEDEEKGLDGFRWWKGELLLPLDEEVAIYRSSSQIKEPIGIRQISSEIQVYERES